METTDAINSSLAKSAYYVCWSLAEVFKDAHHSGFSFRFSQGTYSSGFYHKVIWFHIED